MATRPPLGRKAKQARQGHQDPKAQLGPMVPMAQQAPKDLQVRKDRLATMDRQAQKGIEENKVIMVIRVKKEKKAIRVIRVKKETKVIQDPEAWKASRLARVARPHWRRWRSYFTSDKVGQKR